MATKQLAFSKYHGAGNDFILLDFTTVDTDLSADVVQSMCRRRFGIGADGVVAIKPNGKNAFVLDYYNKDGQPASLCGNGSRCGISFIRRLGLSTGDDHVTLEAYDGLHEGWGVSEGDRCGMTMDERSFSVIRTIDENNLFVDTGSPHHVRFVDDLEGCDVIAEGRKLRYGVYNDTGGSNVNFVEKKSDGIHVRTYERGVEDETLSCGTAAVAVALVTHLRHIRSSDSKDTERAHAHSVDILMEGGTLTVNYRVDSETFTNIELIGEAKHIYDGIYVL